MNTSHEFGETQKPVMGACALNVNGNSTGDREFVSNVFHFLNLIKACLILFAHTFTWFFCPSAMIGDEKVNTPFGPRLSEVHPTNL